MLLVAVMSDSAGEKQGIENVMSESASPALTKQSICDTPCQVHTTSFCGA